MTIDWGDGSSGNYNPPSPPGFYSTSHSYSTVGSYTILVTATDISNPAETGGDFLGVEVTEGTGIVVTPFLASPTAQCNVATELDVYFHDFGPPGAIYVGQVDWGDGSTPDDLPYPAWPSFTSQGGPYFPLHTYTAAQASPGIAITVSIANNADPPVTGINSVNLVVNCTEMSKYSSGSFDLSSSSGSGITACDCDNLPDMLSLTIATDCDCLNQTLPMPFVSGTTWQTADFNECSGGSIHYMVVCTSGQWILSSSTTICMDSVSFSGDPVSATCDPFQLVWDVTGTCVDCFGPFTGTITITA